MVLILLAVLGTVPAWGGAASVQPAEVDLGIPSAVPWMNSQVTQKKPKPVKVKKKPKADLFWPTLQRDIVSVERWRLGLLSAARYAVARPEVFLKAPNSSEEIFEEYRVEALAAWYRALDYFRALDTVIQRYGNFYALEDRGRRRAAFALAYAAYVAQVRFAVEWTRSVVGGALTSNEVDREGTVQGYLNRPIPALGLGKNSFRKLEDRFEGETALAVASSMQSLYKRYGGSRVLKRVLRRGRSSWARQRNQDAAFLPGAKRPAMTESRALGKLENYRLEPLFPTSSSTKPFPEDIRRSVEAKRPFMLAAPSFEGLDVSGRMMYAFHTLRYWFDPPPPAQRPDVLVSAGQAGKFLKLLKPGDILLSRRELSLDAVGESGYWTRLGIFLGTPESRSLADLDFERQFKYFAGERYALARSSTPRVVAVLEDGGVQSVPFSQFAKVDALAALRPDLTGPEIARAMAKALKETGKGFDFDYNFRTAEKLSGAELLWRSYPRNREQNGIRLPARLVYGRPAASVNDIARQYDLEFATEKQQMEFVAFLDPNENKRRANWAPMEAFRASWRRPKWSGTE